MRQRGRFAERIAQTVTLWSGTSLAFVIALGTIVVWLVSGPFFGFSDTWQLVINTGTTVVTFLVVFIIQNTQNRDAQAIHLKLDELIRAKKGARNALLNLDDLSDQELEQIRLSFARLASHAKDDVLYGDSETEVVAITRKK